MSQDEVETVVCLWLAELASLSPPLTYGSVTNHLSAVKAWLNMESGGAIDLSQSKPIKQVKLGLRNTLKCRQFPKQALLIDHLDKISKLIQPSQSVHIRDWAAITVGFFGLFRRSELVAMKWDHISKVSDSVVQIFVPESKTDPGGEGYWVPLVARQDALCPVHALSQLQSVAESFAFEFVFMGSDGRNGWTESVLSASALAKRLKTWVAAIGEDPSKFSGHSLRRGGATALAKTGCGEQYIQLQGRWKSWCFRRYIEVPLEDKVRFQAQIR